MGQAGPSPRAIPGYESPPRLPPVPMEIDILEGNAAALKQCDDTRGFLAMLAGLMQPPGTGELPESRAARGLFNTDVSPSLSYPQPIIETTVPKGERGWGTSERAEQRHNSKGIEASVAP